jgi:hypothetical protein
MRLSVCSFLVIAVIQSVCVTAIAANPELTVIDIDGNHKTLTADDITKLPHQTVHAKTHDIESEFEGVSLVDLLQSIGVVFGEKLRGTRASEVLLVEATDGYRTAISLLEIDPATTDKLVLLADKRDGKPLDEKEGPFRLVLPGEKRPVRWVRSVKTMRIVNLKDMPLDKTP